jgi:hypothetical protein
MRPRKSRHVRIANAIRHRYIASQRGMAKNGLDPRSLGDSIAVNNAEECDSYVRADHVPAHRKGTQKSNRSCIRTSKPDTESARFIQTLTDCDTVWDAHPADLVKRPVCSRAVSAISSKKAPNARTKQPSIIRIVIYQFLVDLGRGVRLATEQRKVPKFRCHTLWGAAIEAAP